MRTMLAVILLAWALVGPPISHAEPETCPPQCDRIPAAAWPDPGTLPLDPADRWPALADVAVPVTGPRFGFEDLCASPPVADARAFAVAARAMVGRPDASRQLQGQIVHWRGETWRGGDLANGVFTAAVDALRTCRARLTTAEPDRVAAVLDGPVPARVYLIVDPRSSTISELLFTRAVALPAWPTVPDARILDAMSAPLCAAYLASCG